MVRVATFYLILFGFISQTSCSNINSNQLYIYMNYFWNVIQAVDLLFNLGYISIVMYIVYFSCIFLLHHSFMINITLLFNCSKGSIWHLITYRSKLQGGYSSCYLQSYTLISRYGLQILVSIIERSLFGYHIFILWVNCGVFPWDFTKKWWLSIQF